MQGFATAKFMLGLFIFAGWIVVTLSVIVFFMPIQAAFWAKLVGLIIGCLNGFLLVAVGQMGLAQIATAENTKRIVEILDASSGTAKRKPPKVARNGPRVEPALSHPS